MFHWNLEDGSGVELTPPEEDWGIWQLWQPCGTRFGNHLTKNDSFDIEIILR